MTRRGYYGLVPGITMEGDLCCILFGATTPIILRKTERVGYYKLIGDAFFASSRGLNDDDPYPYRVGSGSDWDANEDWLEWALKEEDIFLC
jgi:hypothetical protein